MYLNFTKSGYLFISPEDNCHDIVDAMLTIGYNMECCISLDFSPDFITRLMEAGFLVMSAVIDDSLPEPEYLLLPKLHLVRSALFFPNLHIKKSIRRFLHFYDYKGHKLKGSAHGQSGCRAAYELRPDSDFEYIIDRCVQKHGADWLTPPLVDTIKAIRLATASGMSDTAGQTDKARPFSFALYRDGKLVAGEFGIVCGKNYTSYSGFYEEKNAGTVQLIKTTRYLEENGFSFFDLGMPMDYKSDLGAVNISPEEFVCLFRNALTKT